MVAQLEFEKVWPVCSPWVYPLPRSCFPSNPYLLLITADFFYSGGETIPVIGKTGVLQLRYLHM